jgi:hypothetical protein
MMYVVASTPSKADVLVWAIFIAILLLLVGGWLGGNGTEIETRDVGCYIFLIGFVVLVAGKAIFALSP